MAWILKSGVPNPQPASASASLVTTADRLALTAFMAVVIHVLVILGLGFAPPERERREQRSLDVLLVQRPSPTPPQETQYVAEADQEGAGESLEPPSAAAPTPKSAMRATLEAAPAPLPSLAPAGETEESDPPVRPAAAPLSQELVSRDHETPARSPGTELAESDDAAEPRADGSREAMLRARVMADLSAEIDQRLRAFEARPKRKWITARTREHAYAAYMEAWREKVERIGNLNYPEVARRAGLSGSLSLDVALNADGSVAAILLRRSSGEKVLDEAALRIVGLAAPFAEFPPSMREEIDILHIERTWQFSSGNRFNSR